MSLSVAGEKPARYGDHWSRAVTRHSTHGSIPRMRSTEESPRSARTKPSSDDGQLDPTSG